MSEQHKKAKYKPEKFKAAEAYAMKEYSRDTDHDRGIGYLGYIAGYDAAQAEAERKLAIAVEALKRTEEVLESIETYVWKVKGRNVAGLSPAEQWPHVTAFACDEKLKVRKVLAQLRAEKPGAGDRGTV